MASPDLNLLITLEAVLSEGSVARAARRLRLSPSAMSRALARLRETIGDPLLVRAGRGLVPTPRALELRPRVGELLRETREVLQPAEAPDLRRVVRVFTVRTSEGFVENFGAGLIARVARVAPGIRLSFVQKPDKESTPLRDGAIDMETGVVAGTTGPEVRSRSLFDDHFIGVVRPGHPLCEGEITPARYAREGHISVSRKGLAKGLVDEALAPLGLEREIVTSVGGFATAVALAAASDLVATVPERHTGRLRDGLFSFPLPFPTPGITVSLLWHPRLHADPVHRWLRDLMAETCAAAS